MTTTVDELGDVTIALLPKQLEVIEADEAATAYVGGLGTGKTETGVRWMAREVAEWPEGLHVVTALTHDQLSLVVTRRLIEGLADVGIEARERTNPRRLQCGNGAEIQLRSIDNPDPMSGSEIDRLWTDEADFYPAKALRILRERLRGRRTPYARWLATSTPNGFRELYRIFVKEAAKGRTRLVQSSTYDNYFLPAEYIADLERAFAHFPGMKEQQIDGQFTAIGGRRVCPAFDRGRHAARPLVRNPSLPLISCWDFNVARIVCHLAQVATVAGANGVPQQRVQFLRTIRAPHLESAAAAVLDAAYFVNERGQRIPPATFELHGDAPQGALRSPQTGKTSWAYLREALAALNPVPSYPAANPLVVDRAVAMNAVVAAGLVEIDPSCVDLIEDLEKVQWDATGKGLDASDPERTHAYDAASYYVHRRHRPRILKPQTNLIDYDMQVVGADRG